MGRRIFSKRIFSDLSPSASLSYYIILNVRETGVGLPKVIPRAPLVRWDESVGGRLKFPDGSLYDKFLLYDS